MSAWLVPACSSALLALRAASILSTALHAAPHLEHHKSPPTETRKLRCSLASPSGQPRLPQAVHSMHSLYGIVGCLTTLFTYHPYAVVTLHMGGSGDCEMSSSAIACRVKALHLVTVRTSQWQKLADDDCHLQNCFSAPNEGCASGCQGVNRLSNAPASCLHSLQTPTAVTPFSNNSLALCAL